MARTSMVACMVSSSPFFSRWSSNSSLIIRLASSNVSGSVSHASPSKGSALPFLLPLGDHSCWGRGVVEVRGESCFFCVWSSIWASSSCWERASTWSVRSDLSAWTARSSSWAALYSARKDFICFETLTRSARESWRVSLRSSRSRVTLSRAAPVSASESESSWTCAPSLTFSSSRAEREAS